MEFTGFITVTFAGRNGDGVISVPGVKAGDVLLRTVITTIGSDHFVDLSHAYRAIVETDDEIYQTAPSDYTGFDYECIVLRR